MKLKVYEYDKCSTCKKALSYLNKRGIAFDKMDITSQPPTKSELKTMLASMGGDVRKLFNTSGVVYREMKLGEKLPKLSENEALDLLAKNGRLVKRPFVLAGAKGLVGFKQADWDKTF